MKSTSYLLTAVLVTAAFTAYAGQPEGDTAAIALDSQHLVLDRKLDYADENEALTGSAGGSVIPARAGSKGGGGSAGTTQILPVNLGTSPQCAESQATGMSDDGPVGLQVTAYGYGCTVYANHALLWSAATGMIDIAPPPPATGGIARDVSNSGLAVGYSRGGANEAFVRPPGGPAVALPTLSGTLYSMAEAIDRDGKHIIGINSNDTTSALVHWTLVNGVWTVASLSPQLGYPVAVDVNGTTVSNRGRDFTASVWVSRNGVLSQLPGAGTVAHDMTWDGNVIVGFQWKACPSPCGQYEVPVIWKWNGSWTMQVLPALDGVDSEAEGVGIVDGKVVIVGYGYTKKDAVMRAVAWIPAADGTYGSPLRLAAMSGGSRNIAFAVDVNAGGQVVGWSDTSGMRRYAVLWTLPK